MAYKDVFIQITPPLEFWKKVGRWGGSFILCIEWASMIDSAVNERGGVIFLHYSIHPPRQKKRGFSHVPFGERTRQKI
jgi:hypothetical protein